MAENIKAIENEYKPRNLWGLVMGLGLILALPFFTELIIKIVISDTPLPFVIPQEFITICEKCILALLALGIFICSMCLISRFKHAKSKIPYKEDVINDLHDLLENQNFIDGKSTSWESQVELRVKRIDKNIFDVRFRVKDPRGTAEYFRKLNLSEGGAFKNCIDCQVDKDGSFIKLELVFGGERYEE